MKPTLFVLAAGMGSRYGGLKQLDGLGPNGETIMDYSIFDAIRGGFGKIVFVIRKTFEEDFRKKIISKYQNHIPVELVFQDLNDLPEGFKCPEERTKPWGTNHAVLMGKDVINEPFAVINADDFYGRDSFAVLGKWLSQLAEGSTNKYCMVGFRVGNTLSESGSVARGICSKDNNENLTTVVERTEIMRVDKAEVAKFDSEDAGEQHPVAYKDEQGKWVGIQANTPVSMNMWGFTPDYFKHSTAYFIEFLKANMSNIKAEYYIPLMVNKLITENTATVKVLDTTSKWFGVTYAADRQGVVDKIQALINAGEYPQKLF